MRLFICVESADVRALYLQVLTLCSAARVVDGCPCKADSRRSFDRRHVEDIPPHLRIVRGRGARSASEAGNIANNTNLSIVRVPDCGLNVCPPPTSVPEAAFPIPRQSTHGLRGGGRAHPARRADMSRR